MMRWMTRGLLAAVTLAAAIGFASGEQNTKKAKAAPRPPKATPADSLKVAKGFKVELLYSVPQQQYGSWVNMCVDPKGRLIVSDQYGCALPRHAAAARRQAATDAEDREDPGRHRRGSGPALGVRQPVRRGQQRPTARQRPVPRHVSARRTTRSTGRTPAQASTAAAASMGRTPSSDTRTASRSPSSAATRRR